nr:hypothetical protein [Halomonas sp.]
MAVEYFQCAGFNIAKVFQASTPVLDLMHLHNRSHTGNIQPLVETPEHPGDDSPLVTTCLEHFERFNVIAPYLDIIGRNGIPQFPEWNAEGVRILLE